MHFFVSAKLNHFYTNLLSLPVSLRNVNTLVPFEKQEGIGTFQTTQLLPVIWKI